MAVCLRDINHQAYAKDRVIAGGCMYLCDVRKSYTLYRLTHIGWYLHEHL